MHDVELLDDAWICWDMSRTLIIDSTWKILVLLPGHFFLFLLDNWCGGSSSAVLFYRRCTRPFFVVLKQKHKKRYENHTRKIRICSIYALANSYLMQFSYV